MKLNELLLPFDKIYPVGSYYETSNASFNPNTEWGGTWVREDDGTVLVSKKSSGKFNKDIGTIVGEETHQLTIDEMPAHSHGVVVKASWAGAGNTSSEYYNVSTGSGTDWNNRNWVNYSENTGGGQAHNNVQPSTIVYRWHRTS